MLTLVGITFLFTFHNMNNSYLIHIITNVGGSSSDLGKALAVAAVTELPVMFLFSRLARRFPSSTLLMVSGVVFALKAAICMLASHMTLLYASQLLQMGSFALYMPASVYYVNHTMDDRDKFKGQAVMTGTNTLGGVFGSLLGGFLIDSAGVPAMNAAGFGLAACGCVLVLLFAGKRDQG